MSAFFQEFDFIMMLGFITVVVLVISILKERRHRRHCESIKAWLQMFDIDYTLLNHYDEVIANSGEEFLALKGRYYTFWSESVNLLIANYNVRPTIDEFCEWRNEVCKRFVMPLAMEGLSDDDIKIHEAFIHEKLHEMFRSFFSLQFSKEFCDGQRSDYPWFIGHAERVDKYIEKQCNVFFETFPAVFEDILNLAREQVKSDYVKCLEIDGITISNPAPLIWFENIS